MSAATCAAFCAGLLALLAGCERPESVQHGFRGLNTAQLYKPSTLLAKQELNKIPEPEEPADPDSPMVDEVFKNVQVLTDLKATEFSRLMQALSTWVAPVEGCDYCHNPDQLDSDEKYTKVVARRMLQMTRRINTEWKAHVGGTGVTCWTCHRGQAVPSGDWFAAPDLRGHAGLLGNRAGQNTPNPNASGSALPTDPLSTFLVTDNNIRIQGTKALAGENRHSIKQAEWTYSLMMYMANSLGVNCTYCHASRALESWEQSTPQRATAWHGIRMVRDLNSAYLIPLQPLFPANRLSAEGDGPKVGCATCHKGTYKPLNGVSPLKDYPVLAGVTPAPAASGVMPAASGASGKVTSGVTSGGGGKAVTTAALEPEHSGPAAAQPPAIR
jgi:photosynthetic reaction center cytochrome c subunit